MFAEALEKRLHRFVRSRVDLSCRKIGLLNRAIEFPTLSAGIGDDEVTTGERDCGGKPDPGLPPTIMIFGEWAVREHH